MTLVEVVKSLPLYRSHMAYVRDKMLLAKPNISVEEVVNRLGVTRGEAMVILWELRKTGEEVLAMLENCAEKKDMEYGFAALGGTFSVIHVGHMALLAEAFTRAEKVIVGVTSDSYAAKLGKKYPIPSYEQRVKQLREFLGKHGWLERARITALEDPYGPTLDDPAVELIVTSPATAYRASEINMKRAERNLNQLDVRICPLVVAEDGQPVSSTRVMLGEITVLGKLRKSLEQG